MEFIIYPLSYRKENEKQGMMRKHCGKRLWRRMIDIAKGNLEDSASLSFPADLAAAA